MDQIISVIGRILKRKQDPESDDQNKARKVLVVEGENKDAQSNSTTRSTLSSMATPTLRSSSESRWDYDVFLSFRGEDTRKSFTDHLYSALVRVGIRTFLDGEELPRGEYMHTELLNAIRGSRIFIVVFSKGYASSRWCLDELVEIVDYKNTIGHTLLPIFYHVNPSDVRNQTGTFVEAFARHEKRFQTDMKRVQRWRKALIEAANCSGWDLESVANGYESRFIEEIVEEVMRKVNPAWLDVAKHPIGIESRVHGIKDLLNLGTSDVLIVGIYGMGGMGKTTLAKAVYNEICVVFEGSSFLSNLKESSEKPNGLVHLQEKLLNDILKMSLKIRNVDRGISIIKERIHGKKVLVILDDVDDFENLHALVEKQWFGPGSRIIVTTRDEHLLSQLGVDEKYKVEELSHWECLTLFSWHTFKMANPKGDYLELSIKAVDYAGGLPLALVVLGSFLKERSIVEWKSELEKLRRTPHDKIQKILRISFDSLDSSTKEIFLDIAFFFVSMDKDYAIKILDGCNFFPGISIPILIQRSLVTVDSQNKLLMHNLIRDMGREIICQESPKYPEKRSRLWFHEEVLNVLRKRSIFNKLKVLNLSNSKYLTRSPDFSQVPQLEKLILEGCTSLVQVHESIGHLKRLVLLNLKNCTNLKDLPRSIFNLEYLETLDLSSCSALKYFPSSFGLLKNLKFLSLYECSRLTKLPNFLPAPHMESLVLEGCTNLVEIHESIGHLKRLILLDLQRCENLRNLPNNICNLESLEILELSKCFNLKNLPDQLGNMTTLTELYAENTAIKQLPSSFSLLKNLETLSLRGCKCLIESPEFLQTSCLETLILEDCTRLVEVHKSIGLLKRLVCLNLGGCTKLRNLPSNISNLELLETLVLSDCLELDKLPEQLGNMTALKELLADRTAIVQLPCSFGLLKNLGIVYLSGCGGPSSSWISLKGFDSTSLLVSLSGLCSLTKLDLSDRNLFEDEIPIEFGCLSSLKELVLSRNNFRNLPSCISYLSGLSDLFLNECTSLQSISLPKSIQLLEANGCTSLERISILTNESSGSFYLNNCHKLVEIQSLKNLRSASNVLMGRCNNLAYDFRKGLLQMLCRTYNGSLCLPGSEIPNWISHRTIGSLISFHVPSFLDGRIGRLLLCVVYAANKEEPRLLDLEGWFEWTFCNKSKNPPESYRIESRNCYFDSFEDHMFLDVMQFHHTNLEMNIGDEIEMSVNLGILSEVKKCEIQVKKCGFHVLVDEPNIIDEDEMLL